MRCDSIERATPDSARVQPFPTKWARLAPVQPVFQTIFVESRKKKKKHTSHGRQREKKSSYTHACLQVAPKIPSSSALNCVMQIAHFSTATPNKDIFNLTRPSRVTRLRTSSTWPTRYDGSTSPSSPSLSGDGTSGGGGGVAGPRRSAISRSA